MENQALSQRQNLPNSTTILVLGILSIVTCSCGGIIGLALGITAIVLAAKASKLYMVDPGSYTLSSYGNMKAGKVCAIIGVCLAGLSFMYWMAYILMFGLVFSTLPWAKIMSQMH